MKSQDVFNCSLALFLREGWKRKARNAMRTCNGQPDGGRIDVLGIIKVVSAGTPKNNS